MSLEQLWRQYLETDKAPSVALQLVKQCLNGGEISPGMGARFDQPRYQTGFHSLLNFVPLPCGGVTRRPGLELMGAALGPSVRLEPFIFSQQESRILEFFTTGGKIGLAVWGATRHDTGVRLPLNAEHLNGFSLCQHNDVIFVAHQQMRPGKIMRYGETDWRYATINWLPEMPTPQVTACLCEGTEPLNETRKVTLEYCVTAVSSETGEESLATGAIRLTNQWPLTDSWYARISIRPQEQVLEFRIYKKSAGVWGFIGRVAEAENGVFRDTGLTPDTEDTPPEGRDPFGGADGNPALVFLHQQRLGYAASRRQPLTVWLSQAGNLESMAASTPPDQDDAIEVTLAAAQANKIIWAMSDRTGLALGTEGGEWLLQASEGRALTPDDATFQPQTSHGAMEGLAPVRAGSSILFVQRGGRVVREFGYSFQDDRYTSQDLGLLARHILEESPIVSWCYQPEPHGIIWMCQANGKMAGMTYLREHDVIAWHRHKTAGQVKGAAAIPGPDGDWQVWLAVARADGLQIERFRSFSDETCLDDGEPYQSICVPTLPEAEIERGSTFTRLRKLNALTLHVINSGRFQVSTRGLDQSGREIFGPVKWTGSDTLKLAHLHTPLASGWLNCPSLEIRTESAKPLTILGLSLTLEVATATGA